MNLHCAEKKNHVKFAGEFERRMRRRSQLFSASSYSYLCVFQKVRQRLQHTNSGKQGIRIIGTCFTFDPGVSRHSLSHFMHDDDA